MAFTGSPRCRWAWTTAAVVLLALLAAQTPVAVSVVEDIQCDQSQAEPCRPGAEAGCPCRFSEYFLQRFPGITHSARVVLRRLAVRYVKCSWAALKRQPAISAGIECNQFAPELKKESESLHKGRAATGYSTNRVGVRADWFNELSDAAKLYFSFNWGRVSINPRTGLVDLTSSLLPPDLQGMYKIVSRPQELTFKVEDFVRHSTSDKPLDLKHPQLIITGGGGGSGKTSILKAMELATRPADSFHLRDFVHVNCDEAKSADPFYRDQVRKGNFAAGDLVHRSSSQAADVLFHWAVRHRMHIIFDSALKSVKKLKKIVGDLPKEYVVTLIAVTTNPALAAKRAMMRTLSTKRYVRSDTFLHAHKEFSKTFPQFFHMTEMRKVREVFLLENARIGRSPVIIGYRGPGQRTIQTNNQKAYDEFLNKQNLDPLHTATLDTPSTVHSSTQSRRPSDRDPYAERLRHTQRQPSASKPRPKRVRRSGPRARLQTILEDPKKLPLLSKSPMCQLLQAALSDQAIWQAAMHETSKQPQWLRNASASATPKRHTPTAA